MQLYEAVYESFTDNKNDREGYFTVDQFSDRDTSFKIYFPDLVESYIKSVSIESEEGRTYSTILDTYTNLYYLSVYDVPWYQVVIL